MVNLKPCPFCGSENVRVRDYSDPMIYYYFVICKECKSKSGNFGIKEKAIEAWNRRAEDERLC